MHTHVHFFICDILRVCLEELHEEVIDVVPHADLVVVVVTLRTPVRETNAGGLVEPEHIGIVGPGVDAPHRHEVRPCTCSCSCPWICSCSCSCSCHWICSCSCSCPWICSCAVGSINPPVVCPLDTARTVLFEQRQHAAAGPGNHQNKNKNGATSGFEMYFAPSTFGAGTGVLSVRVPAKNTSRIQILSKKVFQTLV